MRLFRLAAAVLLAALAAAMPARAQFTGGIETVIVRPGTVVRVDHLEFGKMLAGPSPGTVTISPVTGARTSSGGVTPMPGAFNEATFVAGGSANRFIFITIPNGNLIINRVGGGATMTVNNWLTNAGGAFFGGYLVRLDALGLYAFAVGARLNLVPNQMAGDYVGSFTVTVNYF